MALELTGEESGSCLAQLDVTLCQTFILTRCFYPECITECREVDINDPDILEAAVRHLPLGKPFQKIRFATIGTGLDLSRLAWLSQSHVFSCQQQDLSSILPGRPKAKELGAKEKGPRRPDSKAPITLEPPQDPSLGPPSTK